jgi:membrane-associated phospholipid phosphatase
MIKRARTRIGKGVKKIWATITLLSLELLVVTISFFIALFAFVFIARMIFWKQKDGFDNRAFTFFSSIVSDVNTHIMEAFTFLGTHYFLIPANIVMIAYFLFIRKHKWYSIKIPVISIGSLLIMSLLKQIFHRARPMTPLMEEARGLSFPSGHAMMSFVFYGLILYIIWEEVKNKPLRYFLAFLLLLLIFFIGISRIYLRVHYASDVCAGFSLGLLWLVISMYVLNKMETISRKKVDAVVVP